eukprot:1937177-Pleurochrysis_carterae.AAC.1
MIGIARVRKRFALWITVTSVWCGAWLTVVRQSLVLRVKWTTSKFGLTFGDGEFTFVLRGQLSRSKGQRARVVVTAHAERSADFHRTRLCVGSKQDIPDRGVVEILVGRGVGRGERSATFRRLTVVGLYL